VDFSDCSRAAARAAAAIVEGPGARLSLLHVLEWPWHEPPIPGVAGIPESQVQALLDYRRYLESSATHALEGIGRDLAFTGDLSTLVRFGKPYVELLDVAREVHADLIVLGVQGRGAMDIGFFGSTSNQVVRRAGCPVLTVRG
jgi:nucleotide-binding universal stress UspA family protein